MAPAGCMAGHWSGIIELQQELYLDWRFAAEVGEFPFIASMTWSLGIIEHEAHTCCRRGRSFSPWENRPDDPQKKETINNSQGIAIPS